MRRPAARLHPRSSQEKSNATCLWTSPHQTIFTMPTTGTDSDVGAALNKLNPLKSRHGSVKELTSKTWSCGDAIKTTPFGVAERRPSQMNEDGIITLRSSLPTGQSMPVHPSRTSARF